MYSTSRKSLNKRLTSGRVLRLRLPTHRTQFALHSSAFVCVCVFLRLSTFFCVHLHASACFCVCPCDGYHWNSPKCYVNTDARSRKQHKTESGSNRCGSQIHWLRKLKPRKKFLKSEFWPILRKFVPMKITNHTGVCLVNRALHTPIQSFTFSLQAKKGVICGTNMYKHARRRHLHCRLTNLHNRLE